MSDEEAIARMTHEEMPLEAYFLLGGPERQSIAYWLPANGVMGCMLDDVALAEAFKRVLRKRGAREFRSAGEVYKVAHKERWPNWERFQDA